MTNQNDSPKINLSQAWIPTHPFDLDRLPELRTLVLVTGGLSFDHVNLAALDLDDRFYWHIVNLGKCELDEVIAWMPLPEPYRPEDAE